MRLMSGPYVRGSSFDRCRQLSNLTLSSDLNRLALSARFWIVDMLSLRSTAFDSIFTLLSGD